jgi:hypothetical protein
MATVITRCDHEHESLNTRKEGRRHHRIQKNRPLLVDSSVHMGFKSILLVALLIETGILNSGYQQQ